MAKKPEIVSSPRRNSYHGLEDASQDWDYKDLVTLDETTGEIRILANADEKVLGQAQADASGTVSTAARVDEWFDGDLIAIDTYNASGGAAVAASTFVKGQLASIVRVSGGSGVYNWYADIENKGGATAVQNALVFVKPYGDLRDDLTDQTITRGLFRLADGICQNTAGPNS